MQFKKHLLTSSVAIAGSVFVAGAAHASSYAYGTNAASNTVVAPKVVQTASTQTASLISSRVSAAVSGATGTIAPGGGPSAPVGGPAPVSLIPGGKGFSAGNGDGKASGSAPKRFGVWANASYTYLENTQANSNFDGDVVNAMAGADYLLTDRILVGLALGYENQDITTKFNAGKLEGNGFTVSPYVAFILNKNISFDLTIGHSWVDYDVSRSNGTITGSTEGDRWFGVANANFTTNINRWQLGATAGYLYTQEKQDAYNESNGRGVDSVYVHLGQARLTGKAGYLIPTGFGYLNPYGSARIEYDVVKNPAAVIDASGTKASNDDFGVTFGLGVSAGIGDSTTVNLEGNTTQFREDLNVYGVSGNVRYKF